MVLRRKSAQGPWGILQSRRSAGDDVDSQSGPLLLLLRHSYYVVFVSLEGFVESGKLDGLP